MATKVLMYGWEFPPFISGGLGVACYDITKALTEIGIQVKFVLPNFPEENLGELDTHVELINSSKVKVYHKELEEVISFFKNRIESFRVDTPLTPYITEEGYLSQLEAIQAHIEHNPITKSYNLNISSNYGKNLIEEVTRYAYVAGFIAKEVEHDLIHCHDWMTVLAGIEAKRHSGKPVIYHVHALETDRSGTNVNQRIYEIERFGLHNVDQIIAVSHYTKNQLIEKYGVDPEKISVVHNAISKVKVNSNVKRKVNKKPNEKIVLFLGRVTFQKGPDYFLEAAAKVCKLNDKVKFVVAGHGDMTHKLIERAAELKLGNKVVFTGFLKRDEVEALFRSADVYVMPSVSEPFGLSSLEAVLFDVPVIMSKQSGVGEVLANALKVDFWDVDELANQIMAVIKYPALNNQLQKAAAEELKTIQWEHSARKIEEIYGIISKRLHYA